MQHALSCTIALCSIALLSSNCMAQGGEEPVHQWLQDHRAEWGITAQDAAAWTVTGRSTDKQGITYMYIRQTANGLPVAGAVANFAVKEGQVAYAGNRLQADVAGRADAATPGITAVDALRILARHLGVVPEDVRVEQRTSPANLLLGTCGISRDPIPAKLIYQPVEGRHAIPLAWELVIRERGGQHWWRAAVDAHSGALLRLDDRVMHCALPPGSFAKGYNAMAELVPLQPAATPPARGGERDAAGYRIFPLPTESPLYGPREWMVNPADPAASPYGWHDTDGMPGAEYTTTRGNNTYAGEDRANNDQMGYSPDGGSGLQFDFPFVTADGPDSYLDAAITNLFYTCNVLHDVWYHYGFDEQGGNFQAMNYTGEGQGNDEVHAQAQDGGGMNNANFATPEDGTSPVMQMYLWRTSEADTFRVNSPSAVAGAYTIETASFGPEIPAAGITADLILVQDDVEPFADGCGNITNGPAIAGKIAVVDRGQCTFVGKVQALQAQGALAVVVVNNAPGAPITMGGTDPGDIAIPSVMVSMANGQMLKNAMLGGAVNATLKGAGLESIRDGDFDNAVIAHEYGHGISNRLTGGPNNVDCLWNDEQMGEGWSDWMAMVLTMHPGDLPETPRGMSNYVLNQQQGEGGLRPFPYTTDMAVNGVTYGITNTAAFQESHALGFVWATMLWDLTWALVDGDGLNPDLYHGTGGNNIAMRIVMDGMKLQPCSPGFVDGRDAILQADELNYGGAHACAIWQAFARRGLGYSASQGSSSSVNDQVEAFDLPAGCIVGVQEPDPSGTGFVIAPVPGAEQMNLLMHAPAPQDAAVRLIGMDGRLLRTWRMPRGTTSLLLNMHGLAYAPYIVERTPNGGNPDRNKVVYGAW